jgi:hypothetical protein
LLVPLVGSQVYARSGRLLSLDTGHIDIYSARCNGR